MVTYIYFVKCPNCEDEPFDFFDEAKDFAMGCLTKKPIITQTEVTRNDFGECTDHCDLGTVWSWEDMMHDTQSDDMVFSKDETFGISEGLDDLDDLLVGPQSDEFASLDNSVDFEIEEDEPEFDDVFEIVEDPVEPITEAADTGLTSEQLTEFSDYLKQNASDWRTRSVSVDEIVEPSNDFGEDEISASIYWDENKNTFEFALNVYHSSMDNNFEVGPDGYLTDDYYENYATIEELYNDYPSYVEYLYDKYKSTNTRKPIPEGMTIEQLKEEMEENEDTVECTWCNDLFDKSECRKEVDLGWLCSRCEMAIKSRGETLTFREGNYWDFLDEDIEDTRTLEDLVKDSISHLTNDLGKDPWADDFADDVIKDIENNYDTYVPEDIEQYNHWCSAVASEVSRQLNNPDNLTEASLSDIAAVANSEFGTGYNERDILDTAGVEDEGFFDEQDTFAEIERQEPFTRNAAWRRDRVKKARLKEEKSPRRTIDLYYDDLDYTYRARLDEVADALVDLVTDEDVARLTNGKFKTVDEICDYDHQEYLKAKETGIKMTSPGVWTEFLDDNCEDLLAEHEAEVLDALRSAAEDDRYEKSPSAYEGPGGGAFSSWTDFWRWKEG